MYVLGPTRLCSTTHEENSGACFRQRFLHSGNLRRDPCARQGIFYRSLVSLGAVGASAPIIFQVIDVEMESTLFVPSKLTLSEYFKMFEFPAMDTLACKNKTSLGEQSLL